MNLKTDKLVFIAELCQNHQGKFKNIEQMIKECVYNGAKIIKLQHIFSNDLSYRYEFENGFNKGKKKLCIKRPYRSEFNRLKKLEISSSELKKFIELCRDYRVEPAITCFLRSRVLELRKIGFRTIKIASYDCGSFPLIKEVAKNFPNIIVSTGASYRDEIEKTANYLKNLKIFFVLLHCKTIYPTPIKKIDFQKINYLKKFTQNVGLSDHSMGFCNNSLLASKISILYGAKFIERHITILNPERTKDGAISINPSQIKELILFSKKKRKSNFLN